VARQFMQLIRNKNLQVLVAANSQSKTVYTFKEVCQAVQAVDRGRREDSDSDSDSDSPSSSTSTDSSTGGGSKTSNDAKNSEESKVKDVEVKMPTPASPKFNMDELAKVIKEAVEATTRELVGSYGLVPGPVSGQPPQVPLIESYAVRSSQCRPQFHGRSYSYGGHGGGYQQQSGPHHQQFGSQQQFGNQQQFGGQSQYPRRSNITWLNCEERGHGYQQCQKPPQLDEARRAI
jgi:hypothetical protein